MWGFSFCSLTAVGRRVPRRKNRCGQGEKSVPPLTISARACRSGRARKISTMLTGFALASVAGFAASRENSITVRHIGHVSFSSLCVHFSSHASHSQCMPAKRE